MTILGIAAVVVAAISCAPPAIAITGEEICQTMHWPMPLPSTVEYNLNHLFEDTILSCFDITVEHVKAVTVPALVAQVHDDTMTRPQDVQDIYDAIPVAEKGLYWIEGTKRRFDGYNFFGVDPEIPIEWFDKHID